MSHQQLASALTTKTQRTPRKIIWVLLVLMLAFAWVGPVAATDGFHPCPTALGRRVRVEPVDTCRVATESFHTCPVAQAVKDWPPLEIGLTGNLAGGVTTLSIHLRNKASYALSDLTVVGAVPAGMTFVDAELISAANPGIFTGSTVEFHLEHLAAGSSLGPLVYRFKDGERPVPARVHAWARWTRPTPGTAISPDLSLAVVTYLSRPGVAPSPWSARLDALLASPDLKDTRVGVMVYDLGTGQVIYERDPQQSFVPASNAKLFTAAAALDVLGPDYRFQTVIAADGLLAGGVLTGSLAIKGYGDPTLTTATLAGWADKLVAAGLKQVSGDVVVDASFFDNGAAETGWAWDLEGESYQPQVGALSVNQNRITLIVEPGAAADTPAQVRTDPPSSYLTIDNRAVTVAAGGRRRLNVYQAEGSHELVVEGQIPLGGRLMSQGVTAQSAGLYTGDVLKSLLVARGVTFGEGNKVRYGPLPAGVQALVTYRSAALRRVLAQMLKQSDNFVSEQVLKTLGAEAGGQGSSQAGQRVIDRFLKDNGLTMAYSLCDACGLSLDNQMSPELLAGLLVLMADHPQAQVFREALAVAGVDGTLATRMRNTPAQRQVQAKTGSLNVASTLSGYATTPDGRNLAFSILMNSSAGRDFPPVSVLRRVQDQMVVALMETPQTN